MGIFPFKPARKAGFFPKCVEETKKETLGLSWQARPDGKKSVGKVTGIFKFFETEVQQKRSEKLQRKATLLLTISGK
jgi:hypothetical protein